MSRDDREKRYLLAITKYAREKALSKSSA